MSVSASVIRDFLSAIHPYDTFATDELTQVAGCFRSLTIPKGEIIYQLGARLDGLYVIYDGQVQVEGPDGEIVSSLRAKNTFGERGLLREGYAVTSARALDDVTVLLLPAFDFQALMEGHPPFNLFFTRNRSSLPTPRQNTLANMRVEQLMASSPIGCSPEASVGEAARILRDHRISSLVVTEEGRLVGLLTLRDITNRVVAAGLGHDTRVADVMSPDPYTLPPTAIGSDVLHLMMERGIGHVPIANGDQVVGIVTQTNLTRVQAENSALLVRDIAQAQTIEQMAATTARIPQLLVHLVGAGNRHEVVTRLITDIADSTTRRLLAMAEEKLGPPPVPYLWLACGSQGRQEQAGVSDQDNCLMLDDAATEDDDAYFKALAEFVCDGLDACGYVYCPGDMMATNPKWRQTISVWRSYFKGWINTPDPMAQMLASVMFDLRPIGGDERLFDKVQAETLKFASRNSIFVAHMVSNSIKHAPPLGLLRGFATLRSGEHKNQIDLKHNGVVPVVDLGRVSALKGEITAVNTRARLVAAQAKGIISTSGGQDLIDAYDLIAETRLSHQARLIRSGKTPDNFMSPTVLSEFERSHLRDAFVVVRTMQSAAGGGRGLLG
ncbi:DUF294 nucleotidyltransferase-like domain-containing protein [Coralliovum pocilloporae]|uniref:DUF294 nucleotidyltransferase-like domain-containing protein n=1 Tax=Coralliovum pocilloporae TaxID=3066369 RepID=UPI00330764EA